MKSPFYSLRWVVLLFIGSLLGGGAAVAQEGLVLNPVKRQEVLEQGRKLLAAREIPTLPADPFYSEAFAEVVGLATRVPGVVAPVGVIAAGPRSARDILQAIATNLKPTGNFVLNGEATLVFGQKRVKAGGFLPITFEGTEYTLEITAIERTHFTLRLNREEFTRPIK